VNSTKNRKEYTLTFENRDTYLLALIEGEKETLSIAHAYWSEIVEKILSTGHKKLLVVEDIPEAISIAEVHQLVSEFAELPVIDIRLAFVDKHPQQRSLNEFGILVGSNRGMTVQAFDSESEAEQWLQSDHASN
jgi:hypothetical protein